MKAASNLHNLFNASLANKPVVPKPAEVPTTILKQIVAPSDVDLQLGATASWIDIREVGEVTKYQDIIFVSLDFPPIPNPPNTGEEECNLKPLTNTDTSKDLSEVVLDLIDDDPKKLHPLLKLHLVECLKMIMKILPPPIIREMMRREMKGKS